ncbi:hypothetical protein [Paraburkholderia sp. J41]|uniref:hypothetical protein n=1 Tax=Paraburkholderia sp. J41 TaxID=2805433 RepID=UPI002AC313DA|nr:hypothetical protein [Paraburkholderia sp. J41]
MNLTDWVLILAIVLSAIVFLCSCNGRRRRSRSYVDRARRAQGTRLLMQAAIALWAALLTLERCFVEPAGGPFGFALRPPVALGAALALAVVGLVWSFRASRLFRARRIFGTC